MAETAAIPVVLQGLGPVGQAIARAALASPDLHVVGAGDPALAGRTLRDLLGPAAPALEIAPDAARWYGAARGGVLLQATSSRLEEVRPHIERAVDAGLSVISTCEELAWPRMHGEEAADALDERCEANGVAVISIGVNPGFVMDRLPVFLAQIVGPVRHVRALRIVDLASRREQLRRKVGIGLDEDAFHAAAERGEMGHVGLAESAALVLAGCGYELEEVADELVPLVAEEDRPGVLAGRVAGVQQVLRGFADGVERVRLELEFSLHADDPRDEVQIDAEPPLHVIVKGGVPGDLVTGHAVVNAVPAVTERHGLLTILDLPAGR